MCERAGARARVAVKAATAGEAARWAARVAVPATAVAVVLTSAATAVATLAAGAWARERGGGGGGWVGACDSCQEAASRLPGGGRMEDGTWRTLLGRCCCCMSCCQTRCVWAEVWAEVGQGRAFAAAAARHAARPGAAGQKCGGKYGRVEGAACSWAAAAACPATKSSHLLTPLLSNCVV